MLFFIRSQENNLIVLPMLVDDIIITRDTQVEGRISNRL